MQFTDTKEFEYTHLPTFNLLDQNLIKKRCDVHITARQNESRQRARSPKKNYSNHIDAQGFRKTKNENPLTWEIRVTG